MKIRNAAAQAAIAKGEVVVSGAVEVMTATPFRAWSGYGDIVIGGNSFTGIGDKGLLQPGGAAIGGSAQNLAMTLGGLTAEVAAMADTATVRSAAVRCWRLIFDGSGTQLLDVEIYSTGRVDDLLTNEVIGGESAITVQVESAARGLGRRGGRLRSDADQRMVKASDGSFSHVSYVAEKQLYWGGRRPVQAGVAIGGGGGARAGIGGRGLDEQISMV